MQSVWSKREVTGIRGVVAEAFLSRDSEMNWRGCNERSTPLRSCSLAPHFARHWPAYISCRLHCLALPLHENNGVTVGTNTNCLANDCVLVVTYKSIEQKLSTSIAWQTASIWTSNNYKNSSLGIINQVSCTINTIAPRVFAEQAETP